MDLKTSIGDDIKTAMKQRDASLLGVLRMATAEIKQVEIDNQKAVNDDDVYIILRRMVKQRQESLSQYQAANRQDLSEKESYEIKILSNYLPTPIIESELDKLVDQEIAKSGADGIKDMGRVIKELKSKLGARADMAVVSKIVKSKLLS